MSNPCPIESQLFCPAKPCRTGPLPTRSGFRPRSTWEFAARCLCWSKKTLPAWIEARKAMSIPSPTLLRCILAKRRQSAGSTDCPVGRLIPIGKVDSLRCFDLERLNEGGRYGASHERLHRMLPVLQAFLCQRVSGFRIGGGQGLKAVLIDRHTS